MKNSGVSTQVARCRVETPLAGVAPTSLDQEEENIMELLVEFELEVPAGTPQPEVQQRERAESTAAAKLAEDGHLARLWRRPLAGDAIGPYRADSQPTLDDLLGALPLEGAARRLVPCRFAAG